MKKIVVNKCFGGFSLSHAGVMAYAEKAGIKLYAFVDKRDDRGYLEFGSFTEYDGSKDAGAFGIHYATKPLDENGKYEEESYFSQRDIKRDDPFLVAVVEEMGAAVNGRFAKLGITEIPDDVNWEIAEYDGSEHVAECHRTW